MIDVSEAQKVKNKLQLQLYLHFERMLPKSGLHYDRKSPFFRKRPSKQQLILETINYLTYCTQHIPKPPRDLHPQLLFLLNICNSINQLITNKYFVIDFYDTGSSRARFYLGLWEISKKVDIEQFGRLDNWDHLVYLTFHDCGWFNDDDWRALVKHAHNFKNLKSLDLNGNSITSIKDGDISQFKRLQWINLNKNPLTKQSKQLIDKLNRNQYQMLRISL